MGTEGLPAVPAAVRTADIHPHAGLLHPAACLRPVCVAVLAGRHPVGVLILLLHPHLGGAHLEVHHPGLHPTHAGGHRAGLPRTPAGGRTGGSTVRGPANRVEPRADVLLLPVRHPLYRGCLLRTGLAREDAAAVLPGQRRTGSGSPHRRGGQPVEPLPHLYL